MDVEGAECRDVEELLRQEVSVRCCYAEAWADSLQLLQEGLLGKDAVSCGLASAVRTELL